MCAAVAGRRGRRVLVVDHADAPGKKILISGGGRCNFTNLGAAPDRYLSNNPHFAKSALGRYTAADFLELAERHRITWHEKTLGQLFCDGSARAIVAMLVDECRAAGVELRLGRRVTEVSRAGRFLVATDAGPVEAPALVVAIAFSSSVCASKYNGTSPSRRGATIPRADERLCACTGCTARRGLSARLPAPRRPAPGPA